MLFKVALAFQGVLSIGSLAMTPAVQEKIPEMLEKLGDAVTKGAELAEEVGYLLIPPLLIASL